MGETSARVSAGVSDVGEEVGEAAAISVLVVDDQARFLRVATALLAAHRDFEVVGQAASGEEAVALTGELRPQLVLMDVRLPGIDGPEATRRILAGRSGVVVVLVSTSPAADLPPDVGSCGAVGFLQKEELAGDALVLLYHRGRRPGGAPPGP